MLTSSPGYYYDILDMVLISARLVYNRVKITGGPAASFPDYRARKKKSTLLIKEQGIEAKNNRIPETSVYL
jgi:hypothetical protein